MKNKLLLSVVSFALVISIVLCLPLTASATPTTEDLVDRSQFQELTNFDKAFYCFGVNGSRNAFYNGPYLTSGYGEPLQNYWSPNAPACEAFKEIQSWNGRQSYFYLPATNTQTSGKYTWGGRLWFATTDNNDYHRDDWSGKTLSYYQKNLVSIPAGQTLYCRFFFGLPQLNFDTYKDFLGSNISFTIYNTNHEAVYEGDTKMYAIGLWTGSLGAPYTSTMNSCAVAMDVQFTAVSEVNVTSFGLSIKGISADYQGLLIDNMMVFTKLTDTDSWGIKKYELNFIQKLFLNLESALNTMVNSITSAIGNAFNFVFSGKVIEIANAGLTSFGNILSSLSDLTNINGESLPYV